MNGWEMAAVLRAKLPAVPVLYASGNPVNPILQVPGSVFLAKPYDTASVIETCHNLLNGDDLAEDAINEPAW